MSEDDVELAVAVAATMRGGDYIHMGAGQPWLWAAIAFARREQGLSLKVAAGGTFVLDLDATDAPSGTYAPDAMSAWSSTMHQSTIFRDLKRPRVTYPTCFQVDARGNGNLTRLLTSAGRTVTGPGLAGLPTLTAHASRFYLVVREHSRRTLVDHVDYVSVLGEQRSRASLGLPAGLAGVITPLATFEPGRSGLELARVRAGTTVAEIRERTGFDFETSRNLMDRAAPSRVQRDYLLDLVRNEKEM